MSENSEPTQVSGQVVLPGMAAVVGYESIELKPKDERFCWEYVHRSDNGTKAYLATHPHVKETTAASESSKLLRNPKVIGRIEQIRAEMRSRLASTVINYHRRVMEVDRLELLAPMGGLKPVTELTEDQRAILEIEQVSSKDGVRTLVKIPSRHQSAESLAKIMGMNKDVATTQAEVNVNLNGAVGVSDDLAKLDDLRKRFGMQQAGSAAHGG